MAIVEGYSAMKVGDLRKALQGAEDWREVRIRTVGSGVSFPVYNCHRDAGGEHEGCIMLCFMLPTKEELTEIAAIRIVSKEI